MGRDTPPSSVMIFNEVKINSYLLIYVHSSYFSPRQNKELREYLKTPIITVQDLVEFCKNFEIYKPSLDPSRFKRVSSPLFSDGEISRLIENISNLSRLVDCVRYLFET